MAFKAEGAAGGVVGVVAYVTVSFGRFATVAFSLDPIATPSVPAGVIIHPRFDVGLPDHVERLVVTSMA